MAPLSDISKKIRIAVKPNYHGEREEAYIFSYTIKITNHSENAVQLLRRKWLVRDILCETREVDGEGVIGESPVIEPNGVYEYTSWCPIQSPFGHMQGSYLFVNVLSGEEFEVDIPPFNLNVTYALN